MKWFTIAETRFYAGFRTRMARQDLRGGLQAKKYFILGAKNMIFMRKTSFFNRNIIFQNKFIFKNYIFEAKI